MAPVKIPLSSGAWAEVRPLSELNGKDKIVVQSAAKVMINWNDPGSSEMDINSIARQVYVVLERIILKWSYEYMIPSEDPSEDEDGNRTWDASLMVLPVDDLNELEEFAEPYLDKLRSGGPKGKQGTGPASSRPSRGRATGSRKG